MGLDLPAFDKEGEGFYICDSKTSFLHVRREEGVSEKPGEQWRMRSGGDNDEGKWCPK